jgi:urea transport system permease protein
LFKAMKFAFKLLWCCVPVFCCLQTFAAPAPDTASTNVVRQELAQVILSKGAQRQKLLDELADTGSQLAAGVLSAWTMEEVYLYVAPDGSKVPVMLESQQDANGDSRAIRIDNGQFVKDAAGKELRFGQTDLNTAATDIRLRRAIRHALDLLALSDPDPAARISAVVKIGNSQDESYVPILQERLAKEKNAGVRRIILTAIATLQLGDTNQAVLIGAVKQLAVLKAAGSLDNLNQMAANTNNSSQLAGALKAAISSINNHIWWVNFYGTIFHGISLGSVLLVVALGLAITFGLMGIINMAHGEMIAVGAYTTYVIQNVFGSGFGFHITLPFSIMGKNIGFGLNLPGLNATGWFYQSYFIFAIPLSFIMAALVGLLLERAVIQFLYRRPLESLLATWGVSLALQQIFRMVFGANNVQVNSPNWLLGHFTVDDVSFDYNRVFVIVFAVLIVIGTWLLLSKTPLGLLIRAVMQNRSMASCMGVRTTRVNMLTFAFGSGLAGLAGAFLSQIGNVGPSMGQTYIVDSFMTVVVGGVGNIIGTVYSALGIGTADQVLQQLTGSPVTGKIVVLVCIILFLQWKPGGLFAIRSRSLD